MMSDFLLRESRIPRLRTAVRLSLYNQIQPEVDARGLARVSAYIERARAHDVACAESEALWYSQISRGRYAADMADLDPLADRLLFGVQNVALGHQSGLSAGHSLAARIDRFLAELFPAGVAAITRLPYVEQAVALERCVDRLHGPLAPMVTEMAIQSLVDRLAEITVAYRASVDAGHGRVPFTNVRAARERGHLFLLEIVAMIVSEYHDADDPDQVAARAELLAPVAEQLAIARAQNRALRGDSDTVPGTDGEDIPEEPTDDLPMDDLPMDGLPMDGLDDEQPDQSDDALVA